MPAGRDESGSGGSRSPEPVALPPQVSVLLPCYNAAATLDEAVGSVLGQTLTDLEVVAVDDGSNDDTRRRLEAWASRDRRLRVVGREHTGLIAALNAGIAECRAALIARMDADDRCHPERLARQAALLGEVPSLALAGCLVGGYPSAEVRQGFRVYLDWLNRLVTVGDIRKQIFVESPLPHPTWMVRRAWLERAGGYQDHGWPEDYDLLLRLHLLGAEMAKVPETLFFWREHPTRLTRIDARYSVENFLRCKAHHLVRGPLRGRETVIVWGAGQMGRRLSKHLLREGAPLAAFVDIDPGKIGGRKRGRPVIAPEDLQALWRASPRPVVLAAVGARGARALIREQLISMGLREGEDWWAVA